jgi:hypothetical protein
LTSKTGTLVWNKRILDGIAEETDGWWCVGHSEAQFGFIHPWKVGPFSTKEAAELAWKEFEQKQ